MASTRELARRHIMGGVAICGAFLVTGAPVWLAVGAVSPAHGYTMPPPSPSLMCYLAGRSWLGALEVKLSPASEATVQAGTPVTFSGYAQPSVTFAVASSLSLLSSPDIDSGLGSVQPEPSGPLNTFTSAKASATPGTIYWDASFSDATLPECAGVPPGTTFTTPPRTLTVLPAPAPPPPPTAPAAVQVSISALGGFRLAHPVVQYTIHCTARCSGETSYEVTVARRHGKAVRVPKLALNPEPVSITATAGGDTQITHDYRGSALRTLKSDLRAGDVLEFQISVKVTDALGNTAHAQRTARLR